MVKWNWGRKDSKKTAQYNDGKTSPKAGEQGVSLIDMLNDWKAENVSSMPQQQQQQQQHCFLPRKAAPTLQSPREIFTSAANKDLKLESIIDRPSSQNASMSNFSPIEARKHPHPADPYYMEPPMFETSNTSSNRTSTYDVSRPMSWDDQRDETSFNVPPTKTQKNSNAPLSRTSTGTPLSPITMTNEAQYTATLPKNSDEFKNKKNLKLDLDMSLDARFSNLTSRYHEIINYLDEYSPVDSPESFGNTKKFSGNPRTTLITITENSSYPSYNGEKTDCSSIISASSKNSEFDEVDKDYTPVSEVYESPIETMFSDKNKISYNNSLNLADISTGSKRNFYDNSQSSINLSEKEDHSKSDLIEALGLPRNKRGSVVPRKMKFGSEDDDYNKIWSLQVQKRKEKIIQQHSNSRAATIKTQSSATTFSSMNSHPSSVSSNSFSSEATSLRSSVGNLLFEAISETQEENAGTSFDLMTKQKLSKNRASSIYYNEPFDNDVNYSQNPLPKFDVSKFNLYHQSNPYESTENPYKTDTANPYQASNPYL